MSAAQKVAVVTGAARGIGLAIARQFVRDGYRVAMLDMDGAELKKAAQGAQMLPIECDVAEPARVNAAVGQIAAHFGRIDALVNNAGIALFKPLLETTYEEWSRVLAVNLDGPFLMVQACAPVMLKTGGGAIVNIASISGLRASTLRVAYGTSKAALSHLTKQQAAELGNLGIRVNAVAPGPVDTAMAKQVHTADIRAGYHDAIPLNRYGTEDEIAAAVCFLCSDAASYVNGQTLAVDGGFDATGIGLPSLRNDQLKSIAAAFNAHDLDAIMEFFADDCSLDMPRGPEAWGKRFTGKAAVREGLAARFKGLPDVHYGDDRHWMSGNLGVSEWLLTGTTPDGVRIKVRGCDHWEFRDGKVIRKDSYWKIVDK